MQFKIIVAVCKNNGIGYKQDLPWKIKEDLRYFSKTTKGNGNNAIVMGKNTWLSIGENPFLKEIILFYLNLSIQKTGRRLRKYNF